MHRSENIERDHSYKNNKKNGVVKDPSAQWFENFVRLESLGKLHKHSAESECACSDANITVLTHHITFLHCCNTVSSLFMLWNEGI